MEAIIFWLVLYPAILSDRVLRVNGLRRDKWHWADLKAMQWGYFVGAFGKVAR